MGEIVSKQRISFTQFDASCFPSQICAVCLEEFKQKDELGICPCKHAFHRKWVSAHASAAAPRYGTLWPGRHMEKSETAVSFKPELKRMIPMHVSWRLRSLTVKKKNKKKPKTAWLEHTRAPRERKRALNLWSTRDVSQARLAMRVSTSASDFCDKEIELFPMHARDTAYNTRGGRRADVRDEPRGFLAVAGVRECRLGGIGSF